MRNLMPNAIFSVRLNGHCNKSMRSRKRSGLAGAFLLVAVLFAGTGFAANAQSQHAGQSAGQQKDLPITTGTAKSSMDAGESNDQLEKYAHAPAVKATAHALGLSEDQGARLFEDINSAILIGVILYFLLKFLPGKFRARRETISRDLVEAERATADAQERLSRIEQRLGALDGEVAALRDQSAKASAGDELRIHLQMEQEKERIVRSAEAEISAAQAAAQRGLKRYAADLAVERAAAQVRLSEEADQSLVDSFLSDLAGELSTRGKN
jgi:F-type H+-transporting ATPase subunit b